MFYIGSNVLDWPLEAQRGIADGHEICARECSSFFGNLFHSDLIVTDTWSHRYSELLCAVYD
jgi:hypothetical protein